MSNDVVHSFFENEKDLAPNVRAYNRFTIDPRSEELKLDRSGREDIGREPPHALHQIA